MKSIPVIQPDDARLKPDAAASGGAPHEGGGRETSGLVADPEKSAQLRPLVVRALTTVFDPEIPVNIYDLGLVYDVIVDATGTVGIRMTLTAPACPAAQFLPEQVRKAAAAVPGVTDAKVDVVWDPPWTRDRMSDAAKLQLGMF
jgi:FeS assembly SUF system protein